MHVEIIPWAVLKEKDHLIVDVREEDEIKSDPVPNARHIPSGEIAERHGELPGDKLLAFLCAGNVRSVKAAEYLQHIGYDNVCVLDKFSLKGVV